MCVLKVFSEEGSFKKYLEKTVLPKPRCHDKGEIYGKRIIDIFKISFSVSDKEWNDFYGQVEDAKIFLRKYKMEIIELLNMHNISNAFLDFPIESRFTHNGNDNDIVVQSDHLPRELISLAGELNLGIEMTIYS